MIVCDVRVFLTPLVTSIVGSSNMERVSCEDQDVGAWTILKWILER
jgi:hypothetical protein